MKDVMFELFNALFSRKVIGALRGLGFVPNIRNRILGQITGLIKNTIGIFRARI